MVFKRFGIFIENTVVLSRSANLGCFFLFCFVLVFVCLLVCLFVSFRFVIFFVLWKRLKKKKLASILSFPYVKRVVSCQLSGKHTCTT